MKVSLAQVDVESGNTSKNTAAMIALVEKASNEGADLILFPEMSDTGYDMPTIVQTASEWATGPVAELKEAASKNGISIVAGVSERTDSGLYNGVAIIDKEGELVHTYRKTHLITAEPMLEQNYLLPGEESGLFEINGIKCGVLTCYEIRFPEISRKLALSGAEILFVPAAWPLVRLPHWETLLRARAIENQVFVVSADRIGDDSGVPFAGTSAAFGPYGNIMTTATQIHEALLMVTIDLSEISTVREQIKVHQDRRPELY